MYHDTLPFQIDYSLDSVAHLPCFQFMYFVTNKILCQLIIGSALVFALYGVDYALAQEGDSSSEDKTQQLEPVQLEEISKSDELEELSGAIKQKAQELKSLKSKRRRDVNNAELELEIAAVTEQLETLDKSFEQIAIGSINLDILDIEEQALTWQEELALIVKPLLGNLRDLTERPRKQENLRNVIATQKKTVMQADQAISSIDRLLADDPSKNQAQMLRGVREKWLQSKEDAARHEQLALYQLSSMNNGGSNWLVGLKNGLLNFFRERGLTILIAVGVSLLIWLLFHGLRKIFDRRGRSSAKHASRTTYRVVAYAQKLLTALLIVVAILMVFFIRGDVLMLVITMALLFAGALGLKNLLPRFVAESRLLLNIGSVREHEQVVINGVPWRVASINIFSKFTNPEIHGTLRLPLDALKDMASRPITEEKWFPSSIGDWVLDSEKRLYEVIRQTPVVVELQSAQGTNKLIPTSDYFSAGMVNLSKSKQIRITNHFGVGYELQAIALDEVPSTLQRYVLAHLEEANLDTAQIDVRVEFEKADESSLNYIVIALLGSKASRYFYRIERTIQQACVAACNDKGWGIPFPQLTVHHSASESSSSKSDT